MNASKYITRAACAIVGALIAAALPPAQALALQAGAAENPIR